MHVPPLSELLGSMQVLALPMAVRFRGITTREVALFAGPAGWTEFSPFLEYGDAEAAAWLAAAIEFGWQQEPSPRRSRIGVNATVPAVSADEVPAVLGRYGTVRTAKVKVAEPGQTLAADIERVRAVRACLGADAAIRVDANGGWSVAEAVRAIEALTPFVIDYVEQPCASVAELAGIRPLAAAHGTRIAADESVRKASDPLAVARAGAADLVIVKAQPLGGIRRALEVVSAAGLTAVVSSALESAVGLGMGLALAAAMPQPDIDCGLGTASLFLDDVAERPIRDGFLDATRVSPDPAALRRLAAGADRFDWWQDRVRRCYRLLAEVGAG